MTHLIWFRRDLRLNAHPALQAALESGQPLLPVFVLDPRLMQHPAEPRQAFLLAGLRRLDEDLRARDSRLVVRAGDPLEELARLRSEVQTGDIYALEDTSPYGRRRDERVSRALPLRLFTGITVHPPQAVRKPDGGIYTVFTPFSKAWKALPLPGLSGRAPERLPAPPGLAGLASMPLPDSPAPAAFPPGEAEALRRLERFLDGRIDDYATDRDRLDLEGTSSLSPYLRFGMLSPLTAARAALARMEQAAAPQSRRGAEVWLNELIWREFYHAILYLFPFVLNRAFNPALREIPWRDAPAELRAWQQGLTGYPVVDACMRQLSATGWMHNRGRMITASFLTKDLLIDWRAGEQWFMQTLVDGDPAANNGGWQWTAGVGTDAAPYFRIFNPLLQGLKFDPRGEFIRRWVPELAALPDAYVHAPWTMPEDVQRRIGWQPGKTYPHPMVDHAAARERALAAYGASKERLP